MNKIEKTMVSLAPPCSAQQVYLLGTYNVDGTLFLQSQAFVCYIPGPPEGKVIGLAASDQMKENILREQAFSLNLCNIAMLPIVESAWQGYAPETNGEDAVGYSRGVKLNIPVLDASPCVEECKVMQTVQVGDTLIVIVETVCTLVDNELIRPYSESDDLYDWYMSQNAQKFNPLLYSVKYYTLSECVAKLNKNNW